LFLLRRIGLHRTGDQRGLFLGGKTVVVGAGGLGTVPAAGPGVGQLNSSPDYGCQQVLPSLNIIYLINTTFILHFQLNASSLSKSSSSGSGGSRHGHAWATDRRRYGNSEKDSDSSEKRLLPPSSKETAASSEYAYVDRQSLLTTFGGRQAGACSPEPYASVDIFGRQQMVRKRQFGAFERGHLTIERRRRPRRPRRRRRRRWRRLRGEQKLPLPRPLLFTSLVFLKRSGLKGRSETAEGIISFSFSSRKKHKLLQIVESCG